MKFSLGTWRLRRAMRKRIDDIDLYRTAPKDARPLRVFVGFMSHGDEIVSIHHTRDGAERDVLTACRSAYANQHEHLTGTRCGVWECVVEP